MALLHPPSVTIPNFSGGFKSNSTYADLMPGETNDAQNCEYTPGNNVEQRLGCEKLLNVKLTASSASTGVPLTGHFFFKSLGTTSTYHVVAAGDSLYRYNSSTAAIILSGLTNNSNTFWQFEQIADPSDLSKDIIVGVNGVNRMVMWDGSGTASFVDSLTSATQVPIASFILEHERRLYAGRVVDATDIDSPVKVVRTEFGTDGIPNPHRFTQEFFVGGTGRGGEIQNQMVLNEQIIFYLRNEIWKFTPQLGDVNALEMIASDIGLYAPYSLVSNGDLHFFLSERGVYIFDGNKPRHISKDIDNLLLGNVTQSQLKYAKAVYDFERNQYKLYLPEEGSNQNNLGLVFDVRLGIWQPPVTGRTVSCLSTFLDSDDRQRIVFGDYYGYLFEDGKFKNDGIERAFNGTVSAATLSTLTDNGQNFPTASDGLQGLYLKILSGVGQTQRRRIISNTSAVLTLDQNFSVVPNSASTYTIAAIESDWRSKDYEMGAHDLLKIFTYIRSRIAEKGNFNLDLNYIIDFKRVNQSTLSSLLMLEGGFAWDASNSRWDTIRWGAATQIVKKTDMRSTPQQSTTGNHLALRYSNYMANQDWRLTGFDIQAKPIGRM